MDSFAYDAHRQMPLIGQSCICCYVLEGNLFEMLYLSFVYTFLQPRIIRIANFVMYLSKLDFILVCTVYWVPS
jgi:hypothetical protein